MINEVFQGCARETGFAAWTDPMRARGNPWSKMFDPTSDYFVPGFAQWATTMPVPLRTS